MATDAEEPLWTCETVVTRADARRSAIVRFAGECAWFELDTRRATRVDFLRSALRKAEATTAVRGWDASMREALRWLTATRLHARFRAVVRDLIDEVLVPAAPSSSFTTSSSSLSSSKRSSASASGYVVQCADATCREAELWRAPAARRRLDLERRSVLWCRDFDQAHEWIRAQCQTTLRKQVKRLVRAHPRSSDLIRHVVAQRRRAHWSSESSPNPKKSLGHGLVDHYCRRVLGVAPSLRDLVPTLRRACSSTERFATFVRDCDFFRVTRVFVGPSSQLGSAVRLFV